MNEILCFKCLNFYPSNEKTCPICNFQHELNINRLYEIGKNSYKYGVDARDIYEKQYSINNRITIQYHIGDPNNFLSWVSLAILSGLIGNFSTAFLKNIVNTIIENAKVKKEKSFSTVEAYKFDVAELDQLIQKLQDWGNDFKNLPDDVKKAIIDEILVDSDTEKTLEIINSGKPFTIEAFRDIYSVREHVSNLDEEKDTELLLKISELLQSQPPSKKGTKHNSE